MRPGVWTSNARKLDGHLARYARDHGGVSQASVLSLLCPAVLLSSVVIWARMTSDMRVSLLTGGDDPNYAIPLAASLADRGVQVEFVGNDAMESVADLKRASIRYLNLRG